MSNYVLTPQAVRKLRGALAAMPGNSGAAGAPSPVDIDDFPPPFTVRWSQRQANKSGNWVVWLPDRAKLVIYSGAFVSTIGSVTAATGLPSGWYTINDADANSTAIYLVVTIVAATGIITAELSDTAGQAVTGTQVINVLVATMSVAANSGAKRTKQFVESVITLGSGGGGGVVPDDISTEFIPDPPAGTQPDGDEGELQIKGFKSGAPADQNTLPDYLQGVANIPSGGISLVCRGVDTNGNRQLFYLPLAALFSASSISGNVSLSFVGDLRWNLSTHTLQQRVDSVNLKTGAVTQGNWETITNGATTPISNII